jgi:hypothetical protein
MLKKPALEQESSDPERDLAELLLDSRDLPLALVSSKIRSRQ